MGERARVRVLVVEDDPALAEEAARLLADSGWESEVVADGQAALAACERGPFSLALVDLDLAGMGGADLAAQLGRRCPETAVVLMGGPQNLTAAIGCMRAGAYDFLTAPLHRDEAVMRVERALERRRLLHRSRDQEQAVADRVSRETRSVRQLFLGAIESLSSALEAKDDYSRGHSERVGKLAQEVARMIGAPQEEVARIGLAGRLHDIGKIGVREAVLLKPRTLTAEEYLHVQSHPVVGERILAAVLMDMETVSMVRNHHEHYGGGGYPDGLRGSAIPLGARLLAVADAFDALTSDRPYRARMDASRAMAVLRAGSGSQWQPALVEALGHCVEHMTGDEDSR
jgi:response regulator RpfG family c-di-GMP phosphodiesterase